MVVSSAGLGLESDCSGKAQNQLFEYITDPSSRQPQEIRNCQKGKKNLVMSSKREPYTKTDWPTDCRSQLNFNFNFKQ
jgi:hypothetical protein